MRIQQNWRNADIFRRIPKDLTEATTTGAIISILCIVVMVLLFLGEVVSFVAPRLQSDMVVAPDTEGSEKLRVYMDMTFPRLPCAVLSLDILDVLHNHELNSMSHLKKTPITHEGKEIRDGRDVKQFVSTEEGCNIVGSIEVTKVPGNFHVSAHTTGSLAAQHFPRGIDLRHFITHLRFGKEQVRRQSIELLNPLDGTSNLEETKHTYQYFLDVVPVVYEGSFSTTRTYQFTSTMNKFESGTHMSAVFFQYQLSPITVRYSSGRVSITHFLTYVCAIIGGVYTVAGLLSRFIYASTKEIQKRMLGKGD